MPISPSLWVSPVTPWMCVVATRCVVSASAGRTVAVSVETVRVDARAQHRDGLLGRCEVSAVDGVAGQSGRHDS